MLAFIPAPSALERTIYPTILSGGLAADLAHVDITTKPLQVRRGKGVAPCRDVAVSSSQITSCGTFRRRECQYVLVDASEAGTWRATWGGENKRGTPIRCVGPLPDFQDLPVDEEAEANGKATVQTYVRAVDKQNTVIYPDAVAGRVYEVTARGLWSSNPAIWGYWGPDGDFNQPGGIVGVGETFEGLLLMRMAVKDAAGVWTYVDRGGQVLCTQDGDLIGTCTDYDGLYADNGGGLHVTVREL